MLLVRGLLLGRLFRLEGEGLMAAVEGGADGFAIKPYMRLNTRREAEALLARLKVIRVSVHQVEIGASARRCSDAW